MHFCFLFCHNLITALTLPRKKVYFYLVLCIERTNLHSYPSPFAMASPPDFANYSLCQSASAIIECKQFETSIKLLQCESVSFGDGSAEFSVCLWPIRPNGKGEPDGDYVYISLRHSTCPSEFWVMFEVSLIDFLGEKQFTKSKCLPEKRDIFSLEMKSGNNKNFIFSC